MSFFVGGVLPACHSYVHLLEFQLDVSLNKLQGCTLLCVVFLSLLLLCCCSNKQKQQMYFVYVPLYLIFNLFLQYILFIWFKY